MTKRLEKVLIGIAIVFILLLSGSCSCHKSNRMMATDNVVDTSDIEVRHQYYYVTDTLHLYIPLLSSERTTTDSTSVLENDLAISEARISEDGSLYHSLRSKPQAIPMPVTVPAERHDSIVYKNRIEYKDRIVEKEPSRWIEAQAWGFRLLFPISIILIIWIFRKHIIRLLLRIFASR